MNDEKKKKKKNMHVLRDVTFILNSNVVTFLAILYMQFMCYS